MSYSQMNEIQTIIRNNGVKYIEDFDSYLDEYKQNVLVLELRKHFYSKGERFLDDWEILSEHKEQLLKEHTTLDGYFFLESIDLILIPAYREIIAEEIYIPFEGEEEEDALADLADAKYNDFLETPYQGVV